MSDYLDCNSTTPIDPRVREVVLHFLDVEYGNPASPHDYGRRAKAAVQAARDQIAAVVAARRHEVFFTSGATESNNLAILGLAAHGEGHGKRHVVSTAIEHSSVMEPLGELRRRGFEVAYVAPDRGGRVDPAAIVDAVRPDTLLVSMMHVNNETGVVQAIAGMADLLADRPVFFHVDAAQGFGREIETLRHPRIDLLSVSAHKIHGPKGVGALIARRREGRLPPLRPLVFGGGQELGLRPGTLPAALIAGLGKAAELALNEAAERAAACRELRQRILGAIECLRPTIHGHPRHTLPHVLNVSFPGIFSEDAIESLEGIAAVSNGSACTSACATRSHVLTAMGVADEEADGAIRLSWCHATRLDHLDEMVAALASLQDEGRGE